MTTTVESTTNRPALTAVLWGAAIILASALPAGGLIAAIAAVSTTYRHSSRTARLLILAAGVLTLVLQLSTAIVLYRDVSGHVTEVPIS